MGDFRRQGVGRARGGRALDSGMDELVIATGNPHKVSELRAILGGLGLRVVGLGDLEIAGEGPFVEPEETGETFEANATIKALSYARQTGRVCLADDSGLEIDALDGRPGVISSHYCTDGAEKGMGREERDRLNNERVMREMEGVVERSARFVCVMVLGGVGSKHSESPSPSSGVAGVPPAVGRTKRKDLPHWDLGSKDYHVTFRVIDGELSPPERQLVLNACLHFDQDRWNLFAACVMPDHVHVFLRPFEGHSLASVMHSIKSYTSHEINRLRGSSGQVWMNDYHDWLSRGGEHGERIKQYIVDNPVEAGICESWVDYPYSYLYQRGAKVDRESHCGRDARHPGDNEGSATVMAMTRGEFAGRIGLAGEVPRGESGFGYDPLFLVGPEFARTSAEMGNDEKNAVSHRGKASREMAGRLRSSMNPGV